MPVYDDQKIKNDTVPGGISRKEELAMEERAFKGADEDRRRQLAEEAKATKPEAKLESNATLDNKEKSLGAPESGPDQEESTIPYRDEGQKGKLVAKLKKRRNKVLIGIVGGGIGGIAAFIIIITGIIGTLLIPQLAQHITEYEFARVTRQFAESAENVTDEKLALDTITTDSLYDKFRTTITPGSDTDQLLSSFDKYRPSQAIKNLEVNNGLGLKYSTTASGRSVLDAVVLDGEEYELEHPNFIVRNMPVLSEIIKFKSDVSFSKDFVPVLDDALRANEVGTIVRSSAAKDIRQELGISLVAWYVGKFTGKTPEQARQIEELSKVEAIDQPVAADTTKTGVIRNANGAAQSTEQGMLTEAEGGNFADLQAAIDNGGISQKILDAITAQLSVSGFQTAIGLINPIYKVAMPICIVYDGSLDNSGSTIDNQTRQQQAAFDYVESAADQEKAGSTDAEAVGATNADLDPETINQSIPEERAAGMTFNTAGQESAEASAGGQYTFLSVTLGDLGFQPATDIADAIDDIANAACPVATNLWVAGGLGILNIVIGIASLGTTTAAEGTAELDADAIADEVGGELAARVVSEDAATASTSVFSRIGTLLKDSFAGTAKSVAEISAATVFAKLVVLDRAMQANSGFAQGVDLANEADSGGNIQAGQLSQQINYGRPLTQDEVAANNEIDKEDISYQTSQESLYQRYLAFSNADSLISRVGTIMYADIHDSFFSSIFSDIGKIFSPSNLISKVFGSFDHNMALAEAAADTSDYGNVQFGWSPAEEALINSDPSYLSPLNNQEELDSAPIINGESAETYVSTTYGQCFTDSIGTLLSSTNPELIVRDKDGNVISNEGLCSPDNLGPPPNPSGPCNLSNLNCVVFRWRLAMSYQNTLNILTQESDVSSSS
jgi:hypothetical protein